MPRSLVGKLETQESWWCSSSPKAGKTSELKVQEELVFLLEYEGREKLMSQLKGTQAGGGSSSLPFVLFRPSNDGCGLPTLRRAVWFAQSIDLNVKLIQKHTLPSMSKAGRFLRALVSLAFLGSYFAPFTRITALLPTLTSLSLISLLSFP